MSVRLTGAIMMFSQRSKGKLRRGPDIDSVRKERKKTTYIISYTYISIYLNIYEYRSMYGEILCALPESVTDGVQETVSITTSNCTSLPRSTPYLHQHIEISLALTHLMEKTPTLGGLNTNCWTIPGLQLPLRALALVPCTARGVYTIY